MTKYRLIPEVVEALSAMQPIIAIIIVGFVAICFMRLAGAWMLRVNEVITELKTITTLLKEMKDGKEKGNSSKQANEDTATK
jgi:hypothetical protein